MAGTANIEEMPLGQLSYSQVSQMTDLSSCRQTKYVSHFHFVFFSDPARIFTPAEDLYNARREEKDCGH
jgi:hypothetical protein